MNNLTVLVDGGWLLMRHIFFFEKGFSIHNSPKAKQATSLEFQESLARSFTKIIRQLPMVDNIVLMSEGGSWRKNLPVPEQLHNITYKGTRAKKSEVDWDAVYKSYHEFTGHVEEFGITHACHNGIEGDDWAWFWSRKLNAQGINVLIWSSDGDLKQLVQVQDRTFTGWYNDKAGLVLPTECQWPEDPMEAMMNPPFENPVLTQLVHRIQKVSYIQPDMVVINKVLCGDHGDNIQPIARFQKNGRNYGFAQKDFETVLNQLNIQKLSDILDHPEPLLESITQLKKFATYEIPTSQLAEMFQYNLQLVWLHEQCIPNTVVTAMVSQEYKKPDLNSLRNNYRLLLGRNLTIENIFDGAGCPF